MGSASEIPSHDFSQTDHVHIGLIDICAVQCDFPLGMQAVDEVVHAVDGSQQGRFSATGRPDESRHETFLYAHIDVEKRLSLAVPEREIVYGEQSPLRPPFTW